MDTVIPQSVKPIPVTDTPELRYNFLAIALVFALGMFAGAGSYFWYLHIKNRNSLPIQDTPAPNNLSSALVASSTPTAPTSDVHVVEFANLYGTNVRALSSEDQKLFEEITQQAKEQAYTAERMYIKANTALVFYNKGADSASMSDGVVYYIPNRTIISRFRIGHEFWIDEQTFVFGNSTDGLHSYSLGTPGPLALPDSKLTGNQTYVQWEGPMGSSSYDVATTSTSVTFGVYDSSKRAPKTPDQEPDVAYYLKVGEKTFHVKK